MTLRTYLPLILGAVFSFTAHPAAADSQTIQLSAGWNLISFQVTPTNPSSSAVFGPLAGNFKAAFTYDAAGKQWTSYQNPATPGVDPAANFLPGVAMATVQPGKGYWVWMNNAQVWQIPGNGSSSIPAKSLAAGWDLIGVPTNLERFKEVNEVVSLQSVLARAGIQYSALLRWESGEKQLRSVSTDPSDPQFTDYDPASGYWINSSGGVLNPNLLFALRSDIDLEPVQAAGSFPGPEDLAISESGGPVPSSVQRQIRFLPGEDLQTISFSNNGGGIVLWKATWVPTDRADLVLPWLSLSTSRDEKMTLG